MPTYIKPCIIKCDTLALVNENEASSFILFHIFAIDGVCLISATSTSSKLSYIYIDIYILNKSFFSMVYSLGKTHEHDLVQYLSYKKLWSILFMQTRRT